MLTIPSPTCFFANCTHPAVPGSSKCSLHKHRTKCVVDQCANQVYARNLCVRHGGKKKCTYDECQLNARIGEYCSKHGGKSSKAICTHDGCTKQAHKRKKCVRHGGGRKCNVDGCDVHARRGGYCARHGRQATTSGDGRLTSPTSSTIASTLPHLNILAASSNHHRSSGLLDVMPPPRVLGLQTFHQHNTAYRSPSPPSSVLPSMYQPNYHHDRQLQHGRQSQYHSPMTSSNLFPTSSKPMFITESNHAFRCPDILPEPFAYPQTSVKLPGLGFVHRGSPPMMAPVAYASLYSAQASSSTHHQRPCYQTTPSDDRSGK